MDCCKLRLKISAADFVDGSHLTFSCKIGNIAPFAYMYEEMEFEKRSSKGSFLQLFEWNVKSRKKLFSNMFELSENSKQGKENFNDSSISRLHQVHENRYTPSIRENYHLSYVSSVNDDDKGTKAPGVVARLMGLDSLPTSNVPEPCFTTYFDSLSFRDSHYSRGISGFRSEEQIVVYDSMRNKLDGFTKNPVDLMLQKVQSRPMERFQTEVLPPKSAKPISVTHHKLLSPIKSPGFIPTMNAAYLMETAAKIIEQSPRSTTTRRLPSLGSSSVSLRIQDIKEKVESAQKSSRILDTSQKARDQSHTKLTKRQPSDRLQGRGKAPDSLRASSTSKNASSEGLKGKARSVSLATQAKVNVQNRDVLTSAGNRSSATQKECNGVKHGDVGRNQQRTQKNVEKRTSVNRQSVVLRQNNQKQNCASNKERDSLRASVSNQKEKKLLSSTEVSMPTKTVNKIVISSAAISTKTNSLATDAGKDLPSSTMKRSLKKPQAIGNCMSDGSSDVPPSKDERSIKCNFETERCTKWDAPDCKSSMDVVSFTFTSPIKKSVPESSTCGQLLEKKRSLDFFPSSCEKQSSFGLDVTGGDALSMLLEEKLKELTTSVDTSHQDPTASGYLCSSSDSLRESVPTLNRKRDKSAEHGKKTLLDLPRNKPNIQDKFDSSSITELQLERMQKRQGSEEVEDHSDISNSECERELKFQYCSIVSSLEPSYSEGSYNSLDSSRSISSKGSKKWVSAEVHEMTDWSSIINSPQVEADNELADSASSTSFGTTSATDISSTFSSIIVKESSPWELEYIRCLLVNTDLRLEEFALTQAHKIIVPNLFVQLEEGNPNVEENLKLGRKLLFDYVGESLEFMCVQLFSGSWKHWSKLAILSQRKDWLAEELYRKVSGWTSMEDLMADELVDKDMSTQLGKWVDFEIEAFEEGVEIEKVILTHLVDELVDELFLS